MHPEMLCEMHTETQGFAYVEVCGPASEEAGQRVGREDAGRGDLRGGIRGDVS